MSTKPNDLALCTPDRMLMALERAKTEMRNPRLNQTTQVAGAILDNPDEPGHRTGVLVLVTLARFDEELLRIHPKTCGILE